MMRATWTVSHPETGVTFGTKTLLRDAKSLGVDAYTQHAVFSGDVECYAYTYPRDPVTGRLRQVAHDDEQGWYTGVEIERAASSPAVERWCGRVGERGFRLFPDADAIHDGKVVVAARSMVECANRAACRKRWPTTRKDDE